MVAHPDDESFGLGAILAAFADAGAAVSVLCLTHGEASTLGAGGDLGARRAAELQCAATALGVTHVDLLDFADGALGALPPDQLDAAVDGHLEGARLAVVFEPRGVTGHPDHRAATAAAERVARRRGIPVLEWGVSARVAAALQAEVGAPFVALGDDGDPAVVAVEVDRRRQLEAIACHDSQAMHNPVLARRLALQGDLEHIRLLGTCIPPGVPGTVGDRAPRGRRPHR